MIWAIIFMMDINDGDDGTHQFSWLSGCMEVCPNAGSAKKIGYFPQEKTSTNRSDEFSENLRTAFEFDPFVVSYTFHLQIKIIQDNELLLCFFMFKIPGDILSDTGRSFPFPAHPEAKVFKGIFQSSIF